MALLGESVIFDLLALISSSLIVIYILLSYQQNKWTRRGIPFANVHPIFGNLRDVLFRGKNLQYVIRDFYLNHKNKPFIAFFTFNEPTIMINDIELVKAVLVKDFNSFTDRNFSPGEYDPMQHHGMFGATGQHWRDLRTNLSPTFTSGKLKRMFQLIDDCGQGLVASFEKEICSSGEVDLKEYLSRYTMDAVGSVAFGIDGNALKDPQGLFGRMMRRAVAFDFKQNVIMTLAFLFPSVADKLRVPLTPPDAVDFVRKTVWENVEYRKKNNVSRNDFLNLMIQLRDKGALKDEDPLEEGDILEQNNKKFDLDGDKFVAQCYLFLTAGYETSSQTMTHAMYELSFNTEIQMRLYDEIKTVLGKHEGKVTYDAVQEMEYLHMVMQETLRKYPVLHILDRRATQPYRLPSTGIELERGDSVMIPVIGIHYDPELYPEPQRFDPERFSEEQRRSRPSCSFLGFGDGPRICIGMRLGYMQAKIGVIHTLLNYEISSCSSTPVPLKFKSSPFNQIDGAVRLRLTKRST